MTKSYHTFFFLLYSIIMNSFIFFQSQYSGRHFLHRFLQIPLFFLLFLKRVPCSSLHLQMDERRRTAPNGPIPAVFWGWGCGMGEDAGGAGMCVLFPPTQNQRVLKKSLTKCLAAGRSLGRDQGRSHADVDAGACSAEVLEYCWR